jgi:hypothetical protein
LPYPAKTAGAKRKFAITELSQSSGIFFVRKEPIMTQNWRDEPPIKQQGHPGYVPPPRPPAFPGGDAGQAPGSPALNLTTAKGMVAKVSVTAGLLFGGFVFAAISLFLPWVTVTVDSPLGGDLYHADASPFKGGWIFAILLVIAGAAWLAWPIVSGSRMSVNRRTGLTAVVGLQIACLFIGFVDYANGVAEKNKAMGGSAQGLMGVHVSVGFGMLLYAAAVVAIAAGVVRVWIHRSQPEKRAA